MQKPARPKANDIRYEGYNGICLNFNENQGCGLCSKTPFGFRNTQQTDQIDLVNFDIKYEGPDYMKVNYNSISFPIEADESKMFEVHLVLSGLNAISSRDTPRCTLLYKKCDRTKRR